MASSYKGGVSGRTEEAREEAYGGSASTGQPRVERPRTIPVRLTPTRDADSAAVGNYAAVHPGYGMAFLDFGFIEPTVLQALQEAVRNETPEWPEVLDGRLVCRVALGYDVLASLYGKVGDLLASIEGALEQRDESRTK